MFYVLRRHEDSLYVAPRGSQRSYVRDVLKARRYPSAEAADQDRCGNESAVKIEG